MKWVFSIFKTLVFKQTLVVSLLKQNNKIVLPVPSFELITKLGTVVDISRKLFFSRDRVVIYLGKIPITCFSKELYISHLAE